MRQRIELPLGGTGPQGVVAAKGMARPEGFEPPTRSLEGCRSIQLS